MASTKKHQHFGGFALEIGEKISNLEIAYTTSGKLNKERNNAVWICHAFTADADPENWWPELVGPDQFFSDEKYFIVCANIIGSPYGTTSPMSINPKTRKPYFRSFPLITVRDQIKAHILLADYLNIDRIHVLIGGSIGGHQAIEWAIMQPKRISHLISIASNAALSPWRIAHNATQRMIIEGDKSFFLDTEEGGKAGMKAARAMALLSYRNAKAYNKTQAETEIKKLSDFRVESYQRYQGEKLARRFNAYCYYSLLKTMDTHQVGRNRGGIEKALYQIEAKTLIIGIASDILFWPSEQEDLHSFIQNSKLVMIDSDFGHDGFLIESDKISVEIGRFLNES